MGQQTSAVQLQIEGAVKARRQLVHIGSRWPSPTRVARKWKRTLQEPSAEGVLVASKVDGGTGPQQEGVTVGERVACCAHSGQAQGARSGSVCGGVSEPSWGREVGASLGATFATLALRAGQGREPLTQGVGGGGREVAPAQRALEDGQRVVEAAVAQQVRHGLPTGAQETAAQGPADDAGLARGGRGRGRGTGGHRGQRGGVEGGQQRHISRVTDGAAREKAVLTRCHRPRSGAGWSWLRVCRIGMRPGRGTGAAAARTAPAHRLVA